MAKGALCCVCGYSLLLHSLSFAIFKILTLTQSCFSCLAASSLGWPSFQAVNVVLHVASLVPIVPPVNVKLVPSENVYVPSVALQRGMQMRLEKE